MRFPPKVLWVTLAARSLHFLQTFICQTVDADDILQHYNWTAFLLPNSSKPWFKYGESFISSLLLYSPGSLIIDVLHDLKFKSVATQMIRNHSERISYFMNFDPDKDYEGYDPVHTTMVASLLFHIAPRLPVYFTPHEIAVPSIGRWLILLDPKLRPVISFTEFKICGHYGYCDSFIRLLLHISIWKHVRLHQLCGIYSGFKIFFGFSKILYLVFYTATDTFTTLTFFDLVASDLVQTTSYWYDQRNNLTTHRVQIYGENRLLSTFSILLNKTNRVKMLLKETKNNTCVSDAIWVFDGPGHLSPQHSLPLATKCLFVCTAFLCVLLTEQDLFCQNATFQYSGVFQMSSLTDLHRNQTLLWSVPHSDKSFVVVLFRSDTNSHVKVTAHNVSFSGRDHPHCLFAGVAFAAPDKENVSEIGHICQTGNNELSFLKPVFSPSNYLCMVVYIFEQYGSFQMKLEVTSTYCQLIQRAYCAHVYSNHLSNIVSSMVLDTVSLGEYFENFNAQYKPLFINTTAARNNCTVIQVRNLRFDQERCRVHPWFFEIDSFYVGVKLIVQKETEQTEHLEYNIYGLLSSMAHLLLTESDKTPETHLHITGSNVQHEMNSDSKFTVYEQQKPKSVNGSVFDEFYFEVPNQKKHILPTLDVKLEPVNTTNLYFSLRLIADAPTHERSPSFALVAWGKYSWLDIYIIPASANPNATDNDFLHLSGKILLSQMFADMVFFLSLGANFSKDGEILLHTDVQLQVSGKNESLCQKSHFAEMRFKAEIPSELSLTKILLLRSCDLN